MLTDTTSLLFQGDSITDGARRREFDGRDLGCGYASMTAAHLLIDRPGMTVHNLGISGNRVTDLYARIKEHAWNLKPDVISILIGVNDTWHERKRGAGVAVERYARVYRMLLEETLSELPDVRFVLCDPFVLECGEVTPEWRPDVDDRRAVVRQLVSDFNAVHVPFQDMFDAALETAGPAHWAGDGVHPTPAGHLLMARAWLDAVNAAD